jgi:hypothetical protein
MYQPAQACLRGLIKRNKRRQQGTTITQFLLNHNRCVKSDIKTYLGKDVLKGLIVKRVSKIEHSLLAFAIAN